METSVLQQIQAELKAPKSQFNDFGKYKYRNAEDIQEALKPILAKHGHALLITDRIVQVGDRFYVEASVRLFDNIMGLVADTKAFAREPLIRKGMDEGQITGATSSYARKYALGGMFLLDDTKDADSMQPEKPEPPKKQPPKKPEKDDKALTPYEVMLGKFVLAKPALFKKTDSDEVYYAGLDTLGVKHANEIKSVADGNKLLAEFRTFLTGNKETVGS